jgi:hypothetical protein
MMGAGPVSQGDQLPQELAGYEELLVGAWRDLVVRIEEGYDDSLPEFQNDLGVRELLQNSSSSFQMTKHALA